MEAVKNFVTFTELENKMRKKWLFWSVLLPGFISASLLILFLFVIVISGNFALMTMGAILFLALFSGGGLYLSYYCAYKKPGTILLLLQMVGVFLNLMSALLNVKKFLAMEKPVFSFVFLAIVVVFDVVVFYYSFKLRRINKSYRKRSDDFDSVHH